MSDYASDRMESRIAEAVNLLITGGDIKNPRLSRFASVSGVSVSKDNAYATLYVSCLDEKELDRSVAALQSAAGFIQARLARVIKTRNTPKLTFVPDKTEIEAEKINRLLESVKSDT